MMDDIVENKAENKEDNKEENKEIPEYVDKYITYSKILDKRKGNIFSKESLVKVLAPVLVYLLFWVFSLIPIFNFTNYKTSPFQNVIFYLLAVSFFEVLTESILLKFLKKDEFDRLEEKGFRDRIVNYFIVAVVAVISVLVLLHTGYAIYILSGKYIGPIIYEKILSEYDAKKKYENLIEEVKNDYEYLFETNKPKTQGNYKTNREEDNDGKIYSKNKKRNFKRTKRKGKKR